MVLVARRGNATVLRAEGQNKTQRLALLHWRRWKFSRGCWKFLAGLCPKLSLAEAQRSDWPGCSRAETKPFHWTAHASAIDWTASGVRY